MATRGFKLKLDKLKKRIQQIDKIEGIDFNDEVMTFTKRVLQTSSRSTSAREYQLIKRNQSRQYDARINCIPDSHTLHDPSLRVSDEGRVHWLYFSGRWWNASEWRLPPEAFAAYNSLLAEHNRRKQIARSRFIAARARSRYLYRQTWYLIANSLKIQDFSSSKQAREAKSRHKGEFVNEARGTKRVTRKNIVVTIFNPLLDRPSRYKKFEGSDIIDSAANKHRKKYELALNRRLKQLIKYG